MLLSSRVLLESVDTIGTKKGAGILEMQMNLEKGVKRPASFCIRVLGKIGDQGEQYIKQ